MQPTMNGAAPETARGGLSKQAHPAPGRFGRWLVIRSGGGYMVERHDFHTMAVQQVGPFGDICQAIAAQREMETTKRDLVFPELNGSAGLETRQHIAA